MRRFALLLVLAAIAPAVARAAGYYANDVGVRGLGRGGAFVARADDGTAAWYNPAGFADQDGTRLHFDTTLVRQSIWYQRTDASGGTAGYDPVGNSASARVVPFLGVSSDFGLKNWVFAISGYGPNGRSLNYPKEGPQRYSLISTNVTEAFAQGSVAWRPHKTLAVGAALRYVYMFANQSKKFSITGTPDREDANDVGLSFDVTDALVMNYQLGVLWSPLPFLDVGLGWRLPTHVVASGELRSDPEDVARLRATQFPSIGLCANRECTVHDRGSITTTFGMPSIFRAGVRYHRDEPDRRRFDVEVDFVWERWNGFGQLNTTPNDVWYTLFSSTPSRLPVITEQRGYGDAFSLRLGGDFEVVPGWLTLRAGAFYETSAVPNQAVNVGIVDAEKVGVSVGLTFTWKWLSVSAGYVHTQLFEQDVRESVSRQINLTYLGLGEQAQAPVVGRGIYRSGWDNFGLGMAVNFDRLYGWAKGK